MNTKGLEHRHGGVITAITEVGHETYKGVADWFFLGDVEWNGGTKSKATRIAPFALGHDGTAEGIQLCNFMHAALTDYLGRTGNWHDMKHKRDGRAYSWTPRFAEGLQPINEITLAEFT